MRYLRIRIYTAEIVTGIHRIRIFYWRGNQLCGVPDSDCGGDAGKVDMMPEQLNLFTESDNYRAICAQCGRDVLMIKTANSAFLPVDLPGENMPSAWMWTESGKCEYLKAGQVGYISHFATCFRKIEK